MWLQRHRFKQGFTLLEVIVVVALIGILATAVIFNVSGSSAAGRDAKRQADLRNLQNAIELYRHENGRYPEGCNGQHWSGQQRTAFACPGGSHEYIIGLAPTFISVLPKDPRLPTDPIFQGKVGYAYITNAERSVYKLMAMNTVESELVGYLHPLKSCDVRANLGGTIVASNDPDLGGWCIRVYRDVVSSASVPNNPSNSGGLHGLNRCRRQEDFIPSAHNDSEFPDSMRRFERSYGVWGGFASLANVQGSANVRAQEIRNTTAVICK